MKTTRRFALLSLTAAAAVVACDDRGPTNPEPVPVITTTSPLEGGTQGVAYSQQLQATGGTGSYSWTTVTGAWPTGIGLSASGLVSGTPSVSGAFTVTVRVTSGAQAADRTYTLTIAPPLVITTSSPLEGGTQGVAYSQQLQATGGTGGYEWSTAGGAWPTGIGLEASGLVNGTPSVSGAFTVTVRVTSGAQTADRTYTLTIVPSLVITTSSPLGGGTQGVAYSQQLQATGGTGSYEWSTAGGAWPTGIGLTASGLVSGIPSVGGTFTVMVRVMSGAQTADRMYTLTIYVGECAVAPQPAPPPEMTTWQWTMIATPLGFKNNTWVRIDPEDDNTWYAGGGSGVFVTNDAGQSWTRRIVGSSETPVEFAPGNACTVYAVNNGGSSSLMRSTDRGRTWATLYEVPAGWIRSIHLGRFTPGLILIGVQIYPGPVPDRFYRSSDFGASWSVQNMDGGSRGLIPWDIEEDINGVLYSGTEIYDHPQPYQPPFFRSTDGGLTWQNVQGELSWHVISIQSHPSDATVYALTEGAGLFMTTNAGDSWTRTNPGRFPELSLLVDPLAPERMFGGVVSYQSWPGGVYASSDGGQSFHAVGLAGITVGDLSLAQHSRVLFAAGYLSGIWRAIIPIQP